MLIIDIHQIIVPIAVQFVWLLDTVILYFDIFGYEKLLEFQMHTYLLRCNLERKPTPTMVSLTLTKLVQRQLIFFYGESLLYI